jgi:hypothetical protein
MSLVQYSWSEFLPAYTGLTGASAGPLGDDASMTAPIGFSFYYCGASYSDLSICTNGWCSLNQSGGSSTVNEFLFTSDEPNTTLAPWWDDLNTDVLSAVAYKTEGSEPDRVFTAEWSRMLTFWISATSRISFQLKLYESTNVIEFIYGSYESGSYNITQGSSIGAEDAIGGVYGFIEGTTGSFVTGISTLQSHSDWPGTTGYRFTPPPVTETFYKLKVSKDLSTLQLDRDINVINKLSVESRSNLIVSPGKTLHTGE